MLCETPRLWRLSRAIVPLLVPIALDTLSRRLFDYDCFQDGNALGDCVKCNVCTEHWKPPRWEATITDTAGEFSRTVAY